MTESRTPMAALIKALAQREARDYLSREAARRKGDPDQRPKRDRLPRDLKAA